MFGATLRAAVCGAALLQVLQAAAVPGSLSASGSDATVISSVSDESHMDGRAATALGHMKLPVGVAAERASDSEDEARPKLTLSFSTTMRAGQGYGHDGDGCILAHAEVDSWNKEPQAVSRIWFDAPGKRLAQSNPRLERTPTANVTAIGRWDLPTPTEWGLTTVGGGDVLCTTAPIPSVACRNGSVTCPPSFGTWGSLDPFTGVLGMNYPNTSLLAGASTSKADVWQWSWVQLTRIPVNGSIKLMNVTRNYTYTVAKHASPDGSRPLLRFQWTQSIPLQPALPVHRDCFVFDYSKDYVAGAPDSAFAPPAGVMCTPGRQQGEGGGAPPASQLAQWGNRPLSGGPIQKHRMV